MPRWRRSSWPTSEPRTGEQSLDRRSGARPRAHRVHHPHAGPGRQRHLSGRRDRVRDRPPGGASSAARSPSWSPSATITAPTPSAPFGVTQAALRMSRAANAVSRRHGEVAREMWNRAVARPRARATSRSATSPTACTSRPGWARRCASCWTATCPRAGASAAADPAVWASASTDPRRRAVGGAPSPAGASWWSSSRAQRRRPPGARRPARLRRRRRPRLRPRGADDRLRPPGGHLQAPGPADPRSRLDAGAARRRAPGAGHPGRQGPPARRGGQARRCRACSGSRRAKVIGERVVFLDDYDLHSAAAPGPRLRRVAQRSPPAAGGQRDERDEVGVQRRPAASACSTAGGRRPMTRAPQRLGDPRRGRLRPPRPGRARRRGAASAARGGGRADLLRARRGGAPPALAGA